MIKAIVDSRSFKSPKSDEHRRVQVLDLYCLTRCYDFKQLRQSSTVVDSKVQVLMSLEECKSYTCIVLLGLRVRIQEEEMSIKD